MFSPIVHIQVRTSCHVILQQREKLDSAENEKELNSCYV